MPEVTHTSWFQRIGKSVGGVIIGIGLFFGSFVVLFINEGTIDKSKIAATAVDVAADKAAPETAVGLVDIAGVVTTNKAIGDGLFLKPGPYLRIERNTEVFAWVEDKKTETRKDPVGGGETTITTYSYKKQWVSKAESENDFEGFGKQDFASAQSSYGEKITNARALNRLVADATVTVANIKMGLYSIDPASVELPAGIGVANLADSADKARVAAYPGAALNGKYLIIRKTRTEGDQVGDERVSYSVLKSDFKGTAFGKLNGTSLESFRVEETLKNTTSLYRIFAGDKQTAIDTLHSEFVFWIWIVRLIGFVMMWFGLMLVFGPISTILDIVSIIGSVSRFLINGVLFLIALLLSLVTIVVGMIAHSVVAIIIALVVVIALIVMIVLLVKNKKKGQAAKQQPA